MNHCCVIGGAGFIGREVVKELLSDGFDVTMVGRSPLSKINFGFLENVQYISGDFSDPKIAHELFRDAETVINLAHSSTSQVGFTDPLSDIKENLPRNVKFFKTLSDYPIEKLLIISSGGTVYGKAQSLPIREDHPTNPISPYGITKLIIEKYAMMFHEINDLPVLCIRPSNIYGEGQRPYAGQGFISTAIASIMENKEVTIFGERGTIRDYVYVSDAAKGIVAALRDGKTGSTYNLGSGKGHSNRDILDTIQPFAERSKFEIQQKILPSRKVDVPANILDAGKLSADTGWKPGVDLKEGIHKVWSAFETHNALRSARKMV